MHERWNIEEHFFRAPKRPGEDGEWDCRLYAYADTRLKARKAVESFVPNGSVYRVRRAVYVPAVESSREVSIARWEDDEGFDEYEGGAWHVYD